MINIRVKILSQSFRTCFEVSTYVSELSERHYNMLLLQLHEGQKEKLLKLVNKCHLSEVQIQDHYLDVFSVILRVITKVLVIVKDSTNA